MIFYQFEIARRSHPRGDTFTYSTSTCVRACALAHTRAMPLSPRIGGLAHAQVGVYAYKTQVHSCDQKFLLPPFAIFSHVARTHCTLSLNKLFSSSLNFLIATTVLNNSSVWQYHFSTYKPVSLSTCICTTQCQSTLCVNFTSGIIFSI